MEIPNIRKLIGLGRPPTQDEMQAAASEAVDGVVYVVELLASIATSLTLIAHDPRRKD